MIYKSENPYTRELLKTYPVIQDDILNDKLILSEKIFNNWRNTPFNVKSDYLKSLAKLLENEIEKHSTLISIEMGKPITQSISEIEKCISLCYYMAENAEEFLKDTHLKTSAVESYIKYEPLGIIYGIMPWNFPYWQVFRYVIPNLILGNSLLLKHASNVPQCAEAIESLIHRAGFPEGLMQNLFIDYDQSAKVIENEYIRGATLTGSINAGSKIAELAGKNVKKTVLELGGSDPFIVLEDADIDKAVDTGVFARTQNAGQSCIAAKRFIIQTDIYDLFLSKFINKMQSLRLGNPLDKNIEVGPLANENILIELEQQVKKTVNSGAKILLGGKRKEASLLFYLPTILSDVNKEMKIFNEEVFGPVAIIYKVDSEEEAISVANDSDFGLGASLWTKDLDKAKRLIGHIQSGMVTVNGLVKSDPALPFGGIKKSGYGRELSEYGLKEFANIKTVNIY